MQIRAMKYGDKPHYEWEAGVLEQKDDYVFLLAEYGRRLRHYTKNSVFTLNNWTIEFMSSSLWFTVAADVKDGRISQYYCNINQPARIEGGRITFVDLDLDYVCENGEWKVVDEEEFEHHQMTFGYPDWLVRKARAELEQLKKRVREQAFPFDGSIERFIGRIPAEAALNEFRLDSRELK